MGHQHNSHLFGSIHHHNGFEMKQTRCALTTDFQLYFGEWCRDYNSFYMSLPLFKGHKVMGQANNHKSNFHFLILGCKSFAVNYSLKSGTHGHHQMMGFIPGDASCCPSLERSCAWSAGSIARWLCTVLDIPTTSTNRYRLRGAHTTYIEVYIKPEKGIV